MTILGAFIMCVIGVLMDIVLMSAIYVRETEEDLEHDDDFDL